MVTTRRGDVVGSHNKRKHAKTKNKSCKRTKIIDTSSDPHFLPVNAAKLTQKLIGLSDEQTETLEEELNRTDEDTLLVIRQNPDFPAGNINPNEVFDAIATYEMRNNTRRDAGDGCREWIFHFNHYQDIGPCKRAMERLFPGAFADPPHTIDNAVANAQRIGNFTQRQVNAFRATFDIQPLAFAVVINKIAIRQDDAGEILFFYKGNANDSSESSESSDDD
ncbi:hypothetical protein THRCLA_22529 [Thraustotheca clavata]|uniref:Uncharacterized protein n=1 Tax=Thraustotheca clavata TaxID=74557 RepID=A0A1V9YYM8_9STRA|nr:hypothetical protein THRCLA_22529 [Thraustotheca clavata]